MRLAEILNGIKFSCNNYCGETEIADIIYDSKNAIADTIFVCITGFTNDGHDFAKDVYAEGTRVFMAEKELNLPNDAIVIYVKDTRKSLALASANLFEHPAKKLNTIAITGTKGKTSISFMLKSIYEAAGHKVGVIGSTGVYIADRFYDTVNSTPESYLIHKYYREMLDSGCDTAIIEATSQGFKLSKTHGINFNTGIFSNLSLDHIGESEHKDFDEYLNCKKKIFDQCRRVIVNKDADNYDRIIENARVPIYTVCSEENADFTFSNASFFISDKKLNTNFICNDGKEKHEISLNTPGYFSLYNATIAIAVARLDGIDYSAIKQGLSVAFVKGRMEIVPTDRDFTVIIDFAHNEFSVKNLFETIKLYNPARIISVFGCGGNRSKLRRYGMGEVIGKNSDLSIITSDNSRFENVEDIINDILIGMHKTDGKYLTIPDRKNAIKEALREARKGDIILLIGKGHELYEEIKGVKYPFDEREIVVNSLDELRQQDS